MISVEEIKSDIEGFNQRIEDARTKLAALPGGHLPYSEHKKRGTIRRKLNDEITHIQRIIGYAVESLEALNGPVKKR